MGFDIVFKITMSFNIHSLMRSILQRAKKNRPDNDVIKLLRFKKHRTSYCKSGVKHDSEESSNSEESVDRNNSHKSVKSCSEDENDSGDKRGCNNERNFYEDEKDSHEDGNAGEHLTEEMKEQLAREKDEKIKEIEEMKKYVEDNGYENYIKTFDLNCLEYLVRDDFKYRSDLFDMLFYYEKLKEKKISLRKFAKTAEYRPISLEDLCESLYGMNIRVDDCGRWIGEYGVEEYFEQLEKLSLEVVLSEKLDFNMFRKVIVIYLLVDEDREVKSELLCERAYKGGVDDLDIGQYKKLVEKYEQIEKIDKEGIVEFNTELYIS